MEMGDLFEGYLASLERPGRLGRPYDEVFDTRGDSYDHYADVVSVVSEMSSEDVAARALRLARAFMDQGVTFDLDGEERPFPLDVVPRIFTTKEWQVISDGVAQRVRALEAFLDDIYNSARILHDGLIPHHLITSSPGFLRLVKAVNPPNGVRIQVAGIDIVRDEDGSFAVLEDNLRSPSGVSYVLANRAAMARVLPEIFWGQQIQLVADYPARLVQALRRAAPAGVVGPERRRTHAGRLQLGFLRARAPRPADGSSPRRGQGPHLSRGGRLPADHRRRGPGPRHLPACGRRVPRPAAVQARVPRRLSRARERSAGRSRDGRERASETASPTTSSSMPTCPT